MAFGHLGGQSQKNLMGGVLAGLGGPLQSLLSGGSMFGRPEHVEKFQNYTPEQQSVMHNLLMQGGQNADWGNIEQGELNRFNQQTIPGLAERFTAMGDSGQRSSGFQQALGGAAGDLGTRLAAMRSQFGMQQLGMGLRPQFENVFRPRQEGGFEQGLGNIMQLLPMLMML